MGNNQGIEGTNKAIKASHTFKRRAPIGAFMEIVMRMVKEWGEKDDSLLHSSRMDFLEQLYHRHLWHRYDVIMGNL